MLNSNKVIHALFIVLLVAVASTTTASDVYGAMAIEVTSSTQLTAKTAHWQQEQPITVYQVSPPNDEPRTAKALSEQQSMRRMFGTFAFGILFAMLLYNSCLYLFNGDQCYLCYVMYALSIIAYELSISGLGDWLVWNHNDWMRTNSLGIGVNLSLLMATLFARKFLSLSLVGGFALRLNTLLVAYWGLSLMSHLLDASLLVTMTQPMVLLSCLIFFAQGGWLWYQGHHSVRFYAIAWGGLFILTTAEVAADSLLVESLQQVGFVAEMLLLSLALAERTNRERQEKEGMQATALGVQAWMIDEHQATISAQANLLETAHKNHEALKDCANERTIELRNALNQLERVNKELRELNITDPLTKANNRRHFDNTLSKEIQRANDTHNTLSLILVDIDHFKLFNDQYGHLVGDDCLRFIASTLMHTNTRGTDLVARYGGEEFAIMLPNTKEEDAYRIAERLRITIQKQPFIFDGKQIPLSASFGIASSKPEGGDTLSLLLERADKALETAKKNGRNRAIAAMSLVS